uniref:Histone acetyltransferase type B catalytic subunit n=1 Tax=Heterorhabditis bacteriophora TaxID=37862 RepID=A0A1I7XTE6_HETBA
MDQDKLVTAKDQQFVAEGIDVITLRFVTIFDNMDSCERFHPEFVHQHFGEKETIFGYENLDICISYSDPSMYIYPEVRYTRDISTVETDMKGDDIIAKLKDQLPMDQMGTMVDSKEAFEFHLTKQSNFKPFGDLIAKFNSGDKTFELFKIAESSPEFDKYLARVQTLALWFIDAAQYTDNSDPRWMHYFLYVLYQKLLIFYDKNCRKEGNGAKLLQCIYRDLYSISAVFDITVPTILVEDPADNFIYLRDYVDCVNCASLPEFSTENLKKGFSEEMRSAALHKLKINKVNEIDVCLVVFVYEYIVLSNVRNQHEGSVLKSGKQRMACPYFATRKLGITDINLFKLVNYMESTDLCKKFHGFYLKSQHNEVKLQLSTPKLSGIAKLMASRNLMEQPAVVSENSPVTVDKPIPSPLFSIKTFIESLNNRCDDGRIIIGKQKDVLKYRFILLNPGAHLSDVIREARATILIGGTMEPAGLLVDCISRGGITNDLRRFSCSHVIDDEQLMAISIGKTIDEKFLTLTYETRENNVIIRSLSATLVELVSTVPNGCVTFFPSYDYMYSFIDKMKEFGLLAKLQQKKILYVEPRGTSSEIWKKFANSARIGSGALLCAVVGGKLSEGINFSDELGRAVIMIGLPYPNRNSTELKEKMAYMDTQMVGGGKQLYHSMCMHSVNQAIGRAIRHRKDFAAVFLLDSRLYFSYNNI